MPSSAVTEYLGERIPPCGGSCDVCAATDILAESGRQLRGHEADRPRLPAAPARTPGRGGRDAPAEHAAPRSGFRGGGDDGGHDERLFAELRQLRRSLADARGIPAYMVFSDATLIEFAARRPSTRQEFLAISGVGPKKLAQYGEPFLALLNRTVPALAPSEISSQL